MCEAFSSVRRGSLVCRLLSLMLLPMALGVGCPGSFVGLGWMGSTSVPETIILPDGDVILPVQLVNHLMFVDVIVNGAGPYKFIVDTASGLTIISPNISRELTKNRLNAATQIGGPSGVIEAPLYRIDSFKIGDVDFQNFTAAEEDVTLIFPGLPFTVDGIIGISLFRSVALSLNYPESNIRIQQDSLTDAIDNCYVLPVTGGDLIGASSYVLPQITITLADQTLLCPLDSGNNGFLLLPSSFEALPFVSPPTPTVSFTINGQMTLLQGKLDGSVAFGCVAYSKPTISVGGSLASLGAVAMQPYVITIDQETKRVRLARP